MQSAQRKNKIGFGDYVTFSLPPSLITQNKDPCLLRQPAKINRDRDRTPRKQTENQRPGNTTKEKEGEGQEEVLRLGGTEATGDSGRSHRISAYGSTDESN